MEAPASAGISGVGARRAALVMDPAYGPFRRGTLRYNSRPSFGISAGDSSEATHQAWSCPGSLIVGSDRPVHTVGLLAFYSRIVDKRLAGENYCGIMRALDEITLWSGDGRSRFCRVVSRTWSAKRFAKKRLARLLETRIIRGLLATKAEAKKFFKRQRLSNRGGCLLRYFCAIVKISKGSNRVNCQPSQGLMI